MSLGMMEDRGNRSPACFRRRWRKRRVMDVLVSGAFWQQARVGRGGKGSEGGGEVRGGVGEGGMEGGETQGENGLLHLKSFISTLSAPVAEPTALSDTSLAPLIAR